MTNISSFEISIATKQVALLFSGVLADDFPGFSGDLPHLGFPLM